MAQGFAAARSYLGTRRMNAIKKTLIYIIVTFLAVVILIPFFWMLSTALQQEGDIFAWPPKWIPDPPQWRNFADAWTAMPFTRYLGNTIFVVALGITAELASATLVAYGFARFRFPGSDFIFLVLLATMMLPFHVTLIPTFLIWQHFGLTGEFDPLVLRAWTAWGPFYIFLLRQFFLTIPKELDDAAEIDGAKHVPDVLS